jgi:hypothetical protein
VLCTCRKNVESKTRGEALIAGQFECSHKLIFKMAKDLEAVVRNFIADDLDEPEAGDASVAQLVRPHLGLIPECPL